ncbi:MAG: diphosphomevalonate decarboxylase [Deltaproteobacteria bacterium]|nr:diphosphomevalonate decarboxylase [Deltaproteobacteria bacterium]
MTTAIAHPNIALVKYWGKRDAALNLPAVPSLSLTLSRYHTRTEVLWGATADQVWLDGRAATPREAGKVFAFLDLIDPSRPPVEVRSVNSFPTAAGLASSASAFAALALAATEAAGRPLPLEALSALARRGSGSAARSLWGGFVAWELGERADGADSHGVQVADERWWDLALVVAVVSSGPKAVGSSEGMARSRATSPYYPLWVEGGPADVERARAAVLARDLPALGEVMESSTFKMHATMHTAVPPLLYQAPATTAVLHEVQALRARGIGAWSTMDAGPNVKVLCASEDAERVAEALRPLVERVDTLAPGPGAHLL